MVGPLMSLNFILSSPPSFNFVAPSLKRGNDPSSSNSKKTIPKGEIISLKEETCIGCGADYVNANRIHIQYTYIIEILGR